MLAIQPLPPAAVVMSTAIRHLAMQHPELAERKGLAFWPVPAIFPAVLADCIAGLQELITYEYVRDHSPSAQRLGRARCLLLTIVGEGDLGEDHTALFLQDHPDVLGAGYAISGQLPFSSLCRGLRAIADPVMQLGALIRNELGSTAEIGTLVRVGLITAGPYSEVHAREEPEHAAVAEEIRHLFYGFRKYAPRFKAGEMLHDELYGQVATWSPSTALSKFIGSSRLRSRH